MRQRKFGFTLAEVMIVLSVIGILSAVLMPIAFKSSPDKNILKFKKAHNTIIAAHNEIVSSGKYFLPGDLGRKPDGSPALEYGEANMDPPTCHALGDVLDAIANPYNTCYQGDAVGDLVRTYRPSMSPPELSLEDVKISFDKSCHDYYSNWYVNFSPSSVYTKNFVYIDVSDSSAFMYHYGVDPNGSDGSSGAYAVVDADGFDATYFPFCIAIDGTTAETGKIKLFGYGLRRDGKIINGARADWWLERDITKKETDCCPKTLNDNGLCDTGDTVCTE